MLENPEFWNLESWNFGIQQQYEKMKVLKIQIRPAQNVGKVWISREKSWRAPIWGHPRQFCPWTGKNPKNCKFLLIFAYFPGVGPLLLSTSDMVCLFSLVDQ